MSYKSEYNKAIKSYYKNLSSALSSEKYSKEDLTQVFTRTKYNRTNFFEAGIPENPTKRDIERIKRKNDLLNQAKREAREFSEVKKRVAKYQEELPYKLAKKKHDKEQREREKGFKNKTKDIPIEDLPRFEDVVKNNLVGRLEECVTFCEMAEAEFDLADLFEIIESARGLIERTKSLNAEQIKYLYDEYDKESLDIHLFYYASLRALKEQVSKMRRYITNVTWLIGKAERL